MSNKRHTNVKSENPVCNTIVTCTDTCTLSDERSVNGGSLFISLIKNHIEQVMTNRYDSYSIWLCCIFYVLPVNFQFHFWVEHFPYDMRPMHNIIRIMHQALSDFIISGKNWQNLPEKIAGEILETFLNFWASVISRMTFVSFVQGSSFSIIKIKLFRIILYSVKTSQFNR